VAGILRAWVSVRHSWSLVCPWVETSRSTIGELRQDGVVGKRSRLADGHSKRNIKVDDAAEVIAAVQSWARPKSGPGGPIGEWMQSVAGFMVDKWASSPMVLRVDSEFAGALMNSNTDVELVPDWLDRFPFNAVAYSLAEPLSLDDGHRLCHYRGMLVTGANTVRFASMKPPPIVRPDGHRFEATGSNFTRYVDIPGAQGVRCLWVFKEDGNPSPHLQTVSFPLRGELAHEPTLTGLIEAQIALAREAGQSAGKELPVLIPLSLSLLLYTAATDPEIDWLPAEHISRPQQLRNTEIGNLGWRTGASLRQVRRQQSGGIDPASGEGIRGLGGWRLPPHIRKAHWHRVRIVERDQDGQVVGDRSGIEGVDWHYEMRWYPPTPVNAEAGIAPTVRDA
jgi:hypothetical protein